METVERLTDRSTAGAGYSTAAAALELQELKASIKDTISETVAAAIEEKMGARGADTATDGANVNKMISDYAAQKKEIADFLVAVLRLTKEIRALMDAQRKAISVNEQDAPSSPTNKRKREPKERRTYEGDWKDGLEYDKSWPKPKRDWFFSEFRKREPARWKKWRVKGLRAQLATLE